LPDNQVVFTANGSDSDGWITDYNWTKVSGPSVSMSGANQSKMTANSLVAGTYEFKVTVTDDDGAKSSAIATLVVNPEPVANQAPTVDAGTNITMTEGSNAFMSASANDSDGWISNYAWTKVSGPSVNLRDQDKLNLTVVSPAPGTYEFQLKVTDNDGATAQDRVQLVVKEQQTSGGDLVIRAGDDFTVDAATDEISTIARWDDIPDAYVTDITWTKVSGPAVTITQGDKARLIAKNINVGVYDFRITVTDSKGRSGSDHVLITVTGGDTNTDPTPDPDPTGDFPVDAGDDFEWDASKGGFNILARWDLPNTYVTGIVWEKVSGPAATLKQKYKAKLVVDNPATGTYKFKVTVTDSKNRQGVDEVIVNVINGGGGTTSGITVDAGDDFEWDLNKGNFNVLARWDIPDAYITHIKWEKVSGNWIKMQDTDKAKLWLIDPSAGVYTFKVSITDSKNRKASDRITVTVVNGITTAMSASDDISDEMQGRQTVVKNFITSDDQIRLISDTAENMQVQLMNITGVTLKVSEFSGELNTSALSGGMYIYQVMDEEGFVIQKGRIIKN
ncbi:MAG: PKD domain-containing protein, partial [Cyclobacteriaceae bacterium]